MEEKTNKAGRDGAEIEKRVCGICRSLIIDDVREADKVLIDLQKKER
jgi:hypothetical protein